MATRAPEHLAEECDDPSCPRFPCRLYKAGQRDGWDRCWPVAFAEGEAVGFASGWQAGFAAGTASAAKA